MCYVRGRRSVFALFYSLIIVKLNFNQFFRFLFLFNTFTRVYLFSLLNERCIMRKSRFTQLSFFLLITLLIPFHAYCFNKEMESIATIMAKSINSSGKKTVAVIDFMDLQGNATELGRFVAEEISSDLMNIDKSFEVIDRTHIKNILNEHKFEMSGLVDPKNARKFGQIAGVDVIITGSVTPFGDTVRITCKSIITQTTKVIGSAKADIPKTRAIEELLSKEIRSDQEKTKKQTSRNSAKSARDIKITIKSLDVTKNQIRVVLGFFNNSDMNYKTGIHHYDSLPRLTDNNGNSYQYESGLFKALAPSNIIHFSSNELDAKSDNDIIIYFKNNGKRSGTSFTFDLKFLLYKKTGKLEEPVTKHNISISNIKAHNN